MTPEDFLQQHSSLDTPSKLREMVSVLTGPKGCPWDQKQTAASIIDFVIDEAHELKSSLGQSDGEVTGELGDLLFTIEFLTQSLASRAPKEAAAEILVEKMIRRHPHVFGEETFADEQALKKNWEKEKRKESQDRHRLDQDIAPSLPPIKKATKVLSRAMNAGFRYIEVADAWDKVCEELQEVENALGSEENFSEELGDLLLSLLTLAKMKKCSAADALDGSVTKLCDRLERLELLAGKELQSIEHEDFKSLYQQVKEPETNPGGFFNYCGVSPWPRPVRKAVRAASQRLGREGLPAALVLREEREEMRDRIAEFCGAPPDSRVVLVPNISSAALGVAYSQPWNEGDKILLGRGEFPANTVPWRSAGETFDLKIVWFDDDLLRSSPERGWLELETKLREHSPKLMSISAVSFWSGFRVSLGRVSALCKKYHCKLFVDAIQALGTTDIQMSEGADFLAGGSHKALCSPEGAGFLLVTSEASADWKPRLASWLSLPDPVDFLLTGQPDSLAQDAWPRPNDPTTLEGGSVNALGYAGLAASLDHLQKLNPRSIFQHLQGIQDPLEEFMQDLGWTSLRARDLSNRSAILSFDPPSGLSVLPTYQRLTEAGFSVSIPNGRLRFGFHVTSTSEEVCSVMRALRPS